MNPDAVSSVDFERHAKKYWELRSQAACLGLNDDNETSRLILPHEMNDIVFTLEGELDEKGLNTITWQYIIGKIRTWFRRSATQASPSPAQALIVKRFTTNSKGDVLCSG